MKKLITFSMFLIFVLFLAGCVEQSNEVSGEGDEEGSVNSDGTIEMTASSALSTQNPMWYGFFEPWMEEVEERTDGRVEFDSYVNEELIPVNEELQALDNKTIDLAAPLWPLYDPQRFPLTEVTMLPLLDTDPVRAAKAFEKLINSDREIADGKTFNEIEYQDRGIKVLPAPTTSEYVISVKDYTIETIEDFQNASLRSPSRVHELFAEELGISTISMPSTELFDAINRGAFEGSFFSIADWTSYGLQDTFTYTLEGLNLGHYSLVWAMSEEEWDAIPADIQEIMEETASEITLEGAQAWMDKTEENRNDALDRGAEFTSLEDLDSEVREFVEEGMVDTWFEWIELQEENGHPGKEVAMLWRDLAVEEGIELPEAVMEIE